VAAPDGNGGSPGNPNPSQAFSGTRVLGTDLTGLGANPYNYEPNLTGETAYTATSPAIDIFYYKNLYLFFQRHLNIEVWDEASIQVSRDNGASWSPIWSNNGYINDFGWLQVQHSVPNMFSRTRDFKMRFTLGPTDGQNNYSGWNIDDVFLTGEFISKDVGITEWIYPLSGCGYTSSEPVVVRIENFGGADITDPFPVGYSFNGGATWTVDICNQIIPVGGSVVFTFPTLTDLSVPGARSGVMAKTMFPGDQETGNDQVNTHLVIIPTYTPPYYEDFEENAGFWHTIPGSIWAHGVPEGSVINSAASGNNSWVTGLSEKYGDLISQAGRIIFEDDFEESNGWVLSGEFERNIPMDLPYFAVSGLYCIGTDLTGMGDTPYKYEAGITPGTSWNAVSPSFDVSAYSNLKVSFMRFADINEGDSVMFAVSPDNGTSWHTVWKNSEGEINDGEWVMMEYNIHDSLAYSAGLKFKFSLFYSATGGEPAFGINIDDFILSGDLVNTAEFSLTSPCFDLSGITRPVFEAKLMADTQQEVDGATLLYSLDGGLSWQYVANASGFDDYWNWYTGQPVSALEADGWSGQSEGWMRIRHLLPAELTEHNNIQLRIKFKADKVDNDFDGIALDDVRIYEAPHDAGVTAVLAPVSACDLSAGEKFTLQVRNFGVRSMEAGDTLRIGISIDREGELQSAEETVILNAAFPAGTTMDIGLDTEFDLSRGGEYHVEAFTIENDPYFFTADGNDRFTGIISVGKPVFSLGMDIYTVRPDTVVLNAYAGKEGLDYLWQDNSTGPEYAVSEEGTYSVRVTNQQGCFETDTINIYRLIADVGVSQVISPVSSCELGLDVPLTISIGNFGTDTLNINDTIFIFGELDQYLYFRDTLVMAENFYPGTFTEFTFTRKFDLSLPAGYQFTMYTVLADDFNVSNDMLEWVLNVYGYPAVDLGEDRVVNAVELVLDAGPGFSGYLWHDGSQEQHFTVGQAGQHEYYVLVTDPMNCQGSDTVLITLNILDVSLDQVLSPGTSCISTEDITVSARIKNNGNLPLLSGESIYIGYTIEGSIPVENEFILQADLLPGSTTDYIFPETVTAEKGNWYDLSVYINYPGDMRSWNDTVLMPVGFFDPPQVDLGPAFQTVTALEYILDAGPGFAGYLWQDGSTGQTYTVNTPGIYTYSVTVTDHLGCTAFDQIQILLVVPDIGVSAIIHPATACALGSEERIMIAVKNYGNTNLAPSANIKVAFSVNGSAPVIEDLYRTYTFGAGTEIYHTFSGALDFSPVGTYLVSAWTIFAADLVPSNDEASLQIEVYGQPVVDISGGQDTIVVFDQIVLTAAPGYPSYLWQDGSTANTYYIDTPGAGLYHVTVTDDNGCFASDTVFVAYDLPDVALLRIVSPVSSCSVDGPEEVSIEIQNNGFYLIPAGELIKVSSSVNNQPAVIEYIALAGALHPGGTEILYLDNMLDLSARGTYPIEAVIEFTADQDPSNDAVFMEIEVWDNPVVSLGAGNDVIKADLPLVLNAGEGHSTYVWQDSSTGSTYTVTEYGRYWVTVSNEHGCHVTDTVTVDTTVGINDPVHGTGQIRIFPNPVSDILYIVSEYDTLRDFSIQLFSIQGRLLYREEFKNIPFLEEQIHVSNFAPGSYLLKIITGGNPETYKIIIR
jgi:hypothetical protein